MSAKIRRKRRDSAWRKRDGEWGFYVDLDAETYRVLVWLAAREGRSAEDVLNDAIREALERND